MRENVENKGRKVRSVVVFAIVEAAILVLFFAFMIGNFFVARGTTDRRSSQLVKDNYEGVTSDLIQDIKNISQAGYTLLNTDTVVRLKTYYYDLILQDSYARNTALNNTLSQIVSLVSYYSILDSCALWFEANGDLSYNTLYTLVGDDVKKGILDRAIQEHAFSPTFDGALQNFGGKVLMTLSLSATDGCVLAMQLDTEFLVSRLSLSSMPETKTYSVEQDGQLFIYCGTDGSVPSRIPDTPSQSDQPILKNGRILYSANIAGKIPLYADINASALDHSITVYILFFIIAFVLLCGAALAFFFVFRHFFNRPVKRLLTAMGEVGTGNFDVRIEEKMSSDFQTVYDGFNFMTSSINGYIEENYRQKVMRAESDFKALQAQINPHFLYNCFANIRSLCNMGDIENVERMTDRLAKLFLYMTRNSEPIVTLKDEYENLLNYLDIQKIRFGDRVTLQIDELPDCFSKLKIPKLCLQPLAENAYKYAFAEMEKDGILKVAFSEKESTLRITVEDNGTGLTDEHLHELCFLLENAKETSGLVNVSRRLKHYCDGKGGLKTERSCLGGLAVIIELALSEGGEL